MSTFRCTHSFFSMIPPPPISTLFPYTTLFRSHVRPDESRPAGHQQHCATRSPSGPTLCPSRPSGATERRYLALRSEEHTSELQPHSDLVCRLLLEKKKKRSKTQTPRAHYNSTK